MRGGRFPCPFLSPLRPLSWAVKACVACAACAACAAPTPSCADEPWGLHVSARPRPHRPPSFPRLCLLLVSCVAVPDTRFCTVSGSPDTSFWSRPSDYFGRARQFLFEAPLSSPSADFRAGLWPIRCGVCLLLSMREGMCGRVCLCVPPLLPSCRPTPSSPRLLLGLREKSGGRRGRESV